LSKIGTPTNVRTSLMTVAGTPVTPYFIARSWCSYASIVSESTMPFGASIDSWLASRTLEGQKGQFGVMTVLTTTGFLIFINFSFR
jgi:hypothetical protein